MATQVQWRGGSTAEHATFTGAAREVTVDTQKKTLVVHDGSTAGGVPLLRENQSNLPTTAPTTGIYNASGSLAISTNGTRRLSIDSNGYIYGTASALSGDSLNTNGIGFFGGGVKQQSTVGYDFTQFYTSSGQAWPDAAFFIPASNSFGIKTNGSERLRITSAGLVGIGTSVPQALLNISSGSSTGTQTVFIAGTSNFTTAGQQALHLGAYFSTDYGCKIKAHYNYSASVSSALSFETANSSGVLTEAIRIDSSQRVGIGTSTPSQTLDCAGNIRSYANATEGSLILGSNNNAYIASNSAELRVWTRDTRPVTFLVNDSERARIDSSGRLLVGTSSTSSTVGLLVQGANGGGAAPGIIRACANTATPASGAAYAYLVFGDSTHADAAWLAAERDGGTWSASSKPTRLVFSVTQDGQASPTGRFWIINNGYSYFQSTGQGIAFATTQGAGTTYETILAGHSATNGTFNSINTSFRVFSNGNVQNTNNSYGAISDLKLKENIVNANPQWDDIKALQVRNYNFKEGQTHTQIGLVAQEVELVSPGLVTESPDRDAEGNDLGTVTKSVNYSVLYMKAVKALQEAMERIETLEAKVAALESA